MSYGTIITFALVLWAAIIALIVWAASSYHVRWFWLIVVAAMAFEVTRWTIVRLLRKAAK